MSADSLGQGEGGGEKGLVDLPVDATEDQGAADGGLLDQRAGGIQPLRGGSGHGDPAGEPVLGVTADELELPALQRVGFLVVLGGLDLPEPTALGLVGAFGDPLGAQV